MKEKKNRNVDILFLLGLMGTLLMAVPYMILGENAIFNYHDELDGELLTYILGAKHLFRGHTYPEFMGGMDKTALTMPAPGAVLLFRFFSPCTALVLMQLAGSVVGYIGMYLSVHRLTGNRLAACFTGLCYAYLPFLPVYGLSQYGIPLLFYFGLTSAEHEKRIHRVASCIYAIFFSFCSSFVLAGYGILGCMILWGIIRLVRKKKGHRILMMTALMLAVYVLTNYRLFAQILFHQGGMISHKAEYTHGIGTFLPVFVDSFLHNREHSADDHLIWLPLILVGLVMAVWSLFQKNIKETLKENRRILICTFLFVILCSVFTAAWYSSAMVSLKYKVGALGSFELARVMWMVPCAWYLCLGIVLDMVGTAVRNKWGILIRGGLLIYALAGGLLILYHSEVKPNVMKLIKSEYKTISYSDYYAMGVMEQVKDFLETVDSRDVSEYRVASLGIDPAAALYHGFYTLDGYSNNYDLEYKHRFRKVIAPELEKSEYLADYFDHWGNRCYLFSAEIPAYFTVEKHGFYFTDYQIDRQAFLDLGGCYILSAAYIQNAEDIGLKLLNETPFETEDSYYQIYVYTAES